MVWKSNSLSFTHLKLNFFELHKRVKLNFCELHNGSMSCTLCNDRYTKKTLNFHTMRRTHVHQLKGVAKNGIFCGFSRILSDNHHFQMTGFRWTLKLFEFWFLSMKVYYLNILFERIMFPPDSCDVTFNTTIITLLDVMSSVLNVTSRLSGGSIILSKSKFK